MRLPRSLSSHGEIFYLALFVAQSFIGCSGFISKGEKSLCIDGGKLPKSTRNLDEMDEESLATEYIGEMGSFGSMFDVEATREVKIFAMDVHIAVTDDSSPIEIYTKVGSYRGFELNSNAWTKIVDTRLQSFGYRNPTPVSSEHFLTGPIIVNTGNKQAFYVTLPTTHLRYAELNANSSDVLVSNDHLQILKGAGVKNYPFGDTIENRGFNGALHYIPSPIRFVVAFDANNASFGAMFEVVAKSNIVIKTIDFHTDLVMSTKVEVWTKARTFISFESLPEAWTKVAEADVMGAGKGIGTPIPLDKFNDVKMYAGDRQSFYLTLPTEDLIYSSRNYEVGDTYASHSDFDVMVGVGVKGYPFGETTGFGQGRVFNGALQYDLFKEPTKMPSKKPTIMPSIMPTKLPTMSPFVSHSSSPSKEHSSLPSKSDTSAPTAPPTTESVRTFNVDGRLLTTFEGGNGSHGSMFDVRALNDLVIRSIEFHTDFIDKVTPVTVWTKKGSYIGFEKDESAWRKIASEYVLGQGLGHGTLIYESFKPVSLKASDTQAFYVTMPTKNLMYSNSDIKTGELYFRNLDMETYVGVGVSDLFGETFDDRIFNGIVHFSIENEHVTESPTISATKETTPPPLTSVPSFLPDGPQEIVTQVVIKLKKGSRKLIERKLLDNYAIAFFQYVTKNFLTVFLSKTDPPIKIKSVMVDQQPAKVERKQGSVRSRNLLDKDTRGPSIYQFMGSIFRVLGADSSEDSIEMYTTITGEYDPPPFVDFGEIVNDAFNDKGDVFLEALKKEKSFEEIEAIELEEVSFAIPTQSPVIDTPSSEASVILIAIYVSCGVFAFIIVACIVLRRIKRKHQRDTVPVLPKQSRYSEKDDNAESNGKSSITLATGYTAEASTRSFGIGEGHKSYRSFVA